MADLDFSVAVLRRHLRPCSGSTVTYDFPSARDRNPSFALLDAALPISAAGVLVVKSEAEFKVAG